MHVKKIPPPLTALAGHSDLFLSVHIHHFTPKNVNTRYQPQPGRFGAMVIAVECLRNVPQTVPDGVCGALVHIILPVSFH